MDTTNHTVTLPMQEYQALVDDSTRFQAGMNINRLIIDRTSRFLNSFADEIDRKMIDGTCQVGHLTGLIRKMVADKGRIEDLLKDC